MTSKEKTALFEKCYSLSLNAAKIQALRIVEESKNGKSDKYNEFERKQEAVSAAYWLMKDEFKAAGILGEYEEYEDAMIEKDLNK